MRDRLSHHLLESMLLSVFAAASLFLFEPAKGFEKIPDFRISNKELLQLANELRELDDNAAHPGQIRLSYQGHTNTRDNSDNAKERLFSTVDSSLLRRPSYEKYIALMNNYKKEAGEPEPAVSLSEHKGEVTDFLTTVISSKPMQRLYKFLHDKGHPYAKDPITWRFWLAQLWFVQYSRARGKSDSSGFEHVFIGEAKNGEVSGMHNWLRFYNLERDPRARFDYKGFVIKRFNLMAALKFQWDKEMKRSGSFLIGTSPEYDMALYTMCFLARRGRSTCDVEMDGCQLSITSYDLTQNGKVFIGSIFPSAGRITDTCRARNT